MRVLYVSYDGALDPLGRSQVVPYLEGLSARGVAFDLLTWEKPERLAERDEVAAMEARLAAAAIRWTPLPYRKRPPVLSTALDLRDGVAAARRRMSAGVDLVHARSYPSAVVARFATRGTGVPWIFDIRGFYPDEKVDGGAWSAGGPVYRVTRRIEADLLREAGAIVALTRASLPLLRERMAAAGGRAPIRVIPTCVDLDRFRPAPAPGQDGMPPTLAYFGSIGSVYLLPEMLRFAAIFRERSGGGRLLVLTNGDPEAVRAEAAAQGLEGDAVVIDRVPHEAVPARLAGAAATFFFVRPGRARTGFNQTKLGESLALGLPVLANRGIGDTDELLEGEGVGVLVDGFSDEALTRGADRLLSTLGSPGVAARCRAAAERHYDLEAGVDAYLDLYRSLLACAS